METLVAGTIVGILVGAVVGLLGGGGGILTIPILTTFFGMSASEASLSSILIVFTTSIIGLLSAIPARRVLWREGLIFSALSIPGIFAGTFAVKGASEELFTYALAALLVLVAALMLWQAVAKGNEGGEAGAENMPTGTRYWLRVFLYATGVGMLSGFFGVGGGFAVVPALVIGLGIKPRFASATSLMVLAINMFITGIVRIPPEVIQAGGGLAGLEKVLNIPLLCAFIVGSMLGSVVGERLGRKMPARLANLLFAFLLVTCVILLIFV